MRIVRSPQTSGFTQVPNASLRDKRLSWKARGLHAYLLSHVDDGWPSDARYLAEQGPDGRDACQTALNELAEHGYIERRKRRASGGQWVTDIIVYDVPETAQRAGEDVKPQVAPAPENPEPGYPQPPTLDGDESSHSHESTGHAEYGKPGAGATSANEQTPSSRRLRDSRPPENPELKKKTNENTNEEDQSSSPRSHSGTEEGAPPVENQAITHRAAIKTLRGLGTGQVMAVKAAARVALGPGATREQIDIRAAEIARGSP